MPKIKQPLLKLAITAAYLLFVFAMYKLGVRCLFRTVLGIACPGCGMTRALVCLLHGDLPGAAAYHPMVFFLPLMYIYFLCDGRLFRPKWVDKVLWILLGLGFLIHWLGLLLA